MAREKTKAEEVPLLHPLIEDQTERRSAFKARRSDFISKDVAVEDEAEALANGWEIERRKKKTIRIKKRKAAVDHLEDRIWCLLHNMGYLRDGDLAFVDPPYSGVHYSRFYHVLEGRKQHAR